jgi:excisionase family DNA binding protein
VNNAPLITVEDVANSLGVSISSVRRWIRNGLLGGQRVGGQWRFNRSDVERAFASGRLAVPRSLLGSRQQLPSNQPYLKPVPAWAEESFHRWRDFLRTLVARIQPAHVVVVDRRGAGMFSLLGPWKHEWGKTLWRTMALGWMSERELESLFKGKTVLLFDEMIRHGRQMSQWRERLESVGAQVFSAALIRSHEQFETGELQDFEVIVAEDLRADAFARRAADVSRMLRLVPRPLDVDHLVIRRALSADWDRDHFLQELSRIGTAYTVQEPEPGSPALALSLDRPNFFDTSRVPLPEGLKARWDGPCKIRFYVYQELKECHCCFIAFPSISGTRDAWLHVISNRLGSSWSPTPHDSFENAVERAYTEVTFAVSAELLRQFLVRAESLDLRLDRVKENQQIDRNLVLGTYGPTQGGVFYESAFEALLHAPSAPAVVLGKSEFLPPSLRGMNTPADFTKDLLDFQSELLSLVPRQFNDGVGDLNTPVTYYELLNKLSKLPEPVVSYTIDKELDVGTLKPTLHIFRDSLPEELTVSRAFWRGEYFGAADYSHNILTDQGLTIRRTLGICHEAVSRFLSLMGGEDVKATHFTKLFSNLVLDWKSWESTPLYLSTRPDKYGLIPTVPHGKLLDRQFETLSDFLIRQKCLSPTDVQKTKRRWQRFRPCSDSGIDWSDVYRKTTDGHTRSTIRGLVRMYARIQDQCRPVLPSTSHKDLTSEYKNALTVLGSVRNRAVAYICGCYEVSRWINEGRQYLFPLLASIADNGSAPKSQPSLFNDTTPLLRLVRATVAGFAEPSRQLAFKLDMYRNIGSLREQIAELSATEDLDFCDLLLETIDEVPNTSDAEPNPVGRLETAEHIMRPFSSMVRQVLTHCGLDEDTRPESRRITEDGESRNATYYARSLFRACPQILHLQPMVDQAIDSAERGRIFNRDIATAIQTTFERLCVILESRRFLPMPKTSEAAIESSLGDAFISLATQVATRGQGAVLVIEFHNVKNLAFLVFDNAMRKITYDDAIDSLIDRVLKETEKAAKHHEGVSVIGCDGDTIVCACKNADRAIDFSIEVQSNCKRAMADWDRNQLVELGYIVVGVSWLAPEAGFAFEGRAPALAAYTLVEKCHFIPGTIAVTGAVVEQLSETCAARFSFLDGLDDSGRQQYQRSPQDVSLGRFDQRGVYVHQTRRVATAVTSKDGAQ